MQKNLDHLFGFHIKQLKCPIFICWRNDRQFFISKEIVLAGLWNCWVLEDCLPGWTTRQRKECNPVCKVPAVDWDLYECKWTDAAFSQLIHFLKDVKKASRLGNHFIVISIQKENQNHSYSLKSSASFNVIEFPYKNLPIEDIFNSTLVSHRFGEIQ